MLHVGLAFIVNVPDAGVLEQPLKSVTVTVYVPATVALKLATLPGFDAPAGTDHE